MIFQSKNIKDVPGKNLCDLLGKFANIYTTETIILSRLNRTKLKIKY